MIAEYKKSVDELVLEYRCTRNEVVFKELYKRVKHKLINISEGVYGPKEDKEDCFQCCSIALLRAIETWDPIESVALGKSFSNYLSSALWNERTFWHGNVNYGLCTQDNHRVNFTTKDLTVDEEVRYLSQKMSLDASLDLEGESVQITFLDLVTNRSEISVEDECFVKDFFQRLVGVAEEGLERVVISLMVYKHHKIAEIARMLEVSDSKIRMVVELYKGKVKDVVTEEELGEVLRIFGKARIVDVGLAVV